MFRGDSDNEDRMSAVLLVIFVVISLCLLVLLATYNGLIHQRQDIRMAWAKMDELLKVRYRSGGGADSEFGSGFGLCGIDCKTGSGNGSEKSGGGGVRSAAAGER